MSTPARCSTESRDAQLALLGNAAASSSPSTTTTSPPIAPEHAPPSATTTTAMTPTAPPPTVPLPAPATPREAPANIGQAMDSPLKLSVVSELFMLVPATCSIECRAVLLKQCDVTCAALAGTDIFTLAQKAAFLPASGTSTASSCQSVEGKAGVSVPAATLLPLLLLASPSLNSDLAQISVSEDVSCEFELFGVLPLARIVTSIYGIMPIIRPSILETELTNSLSRFVNRRRSTMQTRAQMEKKRRRRRGMAFLAAFIVAMVLLLACSCRRALLPPPQGRSSRFRIQVYEHKDNKLHQIKQFEKEELDMMRNGTGVCRKNRLDTSAHVVPSDGDKAEVQLKNILNAMPVASYFTSSATTPPQGKPELLPFNNDGTSGAFRNREYPVGNGKALEFAYIVMPGSKENSHMNKSRDVARILPLIIGQNVAYAVLSEADDYFK